ncbi:MAG: SDR family oxidoreductase [Rhodospirillaceae bacterium]|jgi:NAD(P)-dependent dehydrogenase (short-subunit alcohol dehydrogenase family)|nr:SDR family oxidoreductase [Rhodospirillaceae bacterium]MBT6118046.1 SDR family oxidoreductase [Rhodospirillaceae bacterium]
MKLENKKAIVTGAAKGMGAAITTTLAREGADIVLAARDIEALEEVAKEVRALGRQAHTVACDVIDESQVKAMVDGALDFFDGRIDLLVNVAGVTGPIETPIQDIAAEDFDHVIIANERGTFLPIKHVAPTMIAQKSGKIVNIGGTSGLRGYPMRTAYSASKWAVRGITRTVALELGKYNINVNAVCPGIVETPRMMKLCEGKAKVRGWTVQEVYDEYVEDMALKRVTTPQDVANAVLFVASEDSRQITGQHIAVDGGWDV